MKDKIKVLFIGNSHTYYNDMAYMLKCLSVENSDGLTVEPVMLAHPWKTLEQHKTEPEIRFNILYGEYDYIVLQQAAHPFPGEEVLLRDGSAIYEFIKQTKAKPILYMTWAERKFPENQTAMTEAYQHLSDEINGLVAPVGIAFEKAARATPYIELFDRDGGHANPTGSYLAACVFYSLIFNKSPEGLSNKIMYNEKCIYEIDEAEAEVLQRTAWEVYSEI